MSHTVRRTFDGYATGTAAVEMDERAEMIFNLRMVKARAVGYGSPIEVIFEKYSQEAARQQGLDREPRNIALRAD